MLNVRDRENGSRKKKVLTVERDVFLVRTGFDGTGAYLGQCSLEN